MNGMFKEILSKISDRKLRIIDKHRFAKEIGVVGRAVVTEVFLPDEPRFKMPGMGRCELKTEANGRRTAEFYGNSTGYLNPLDKKIPLSIDEQHLDLLKQHYPNHNIQFNPSRKSYT